ncbi:pilus assembly protein CpaE [Pedomonas mirosovicensis]|uniref:pilus assembly protein CpaE n=1 Tax=Pedomonas mirosovicensis TaxID=2908641 RepID=UPI002169FA80|nr:pilus assembly protein CpaE [Pedomonas mirosovicensis]MCH8685437.1 pilus assembly protein CpaE [Pedomonas mirosovicensis]
MNAPWSSNQRFANAQRDIFAAFVCDDATAEALKNSVLDMGWAPDKIHKGGLANAVQTLSVSASPQILLVDLTDCHDPLNDINALAEVCEPGTIVVAIGTVNDVRLYRELLGSGIHDYLLKPISGPALHEALHNAQAALLAPKAAPDEAESANSTIAVIGARGGVGASTVAASLAWAGADTLGRRTALLDFDIHFGVGALAFDLEPGRGLTDALENPARIDSLFIERAIVKASENLAVLSAEAPINAPLLTDGSALLHLHEQVAQTYETIVMDLPRLFAVQNPLLVAEAGHVIIVTDLTLAAARDTLRLMGFLSTHAPTAKVHLVANKVPAQGQTEVSRKDFEASVESAIGTVLSLDPKLAIAAAQQGKSLAEVAKGGKTGAALIDLARSIMAPDGGEEPNKAPLFAKFKNLKSLLPVKSR